MAAPPATTRDRTTCLICDATNAPGAVACQECSAPMALVHEAVARKRDPALVTIMGDSNVGKTVYLGFLLDMLSQRANNFEAVPKGAYSVNLPQIVISHMAYRIFPPKTPMESNEWNWAYYQVCKRSRSPKWADLVMPDIAGEALSAEVDSPTTFRIIHNLLARSAGVLLLVDAALAANGSVQPDFFALKMLSYIDATFAGSEKKRRIDVPIAVVLTKADYCSEAFEDPARFARANLNRTWNLCATRFAAVEFFASSVIGALAYAVGDGNASVRPVPLHTALRGVMEPFEWIVERL